MQEKEKKMNIRLTKVTVRDLFEGYDNQYEDGVVGFGGKLDIRPKFQREFVYNAQQRDAVIDSILNGHPISVMYWLKTGDDTYELMDGQQRTISICEYVEGNFAVNECYYFKLPQETQEKILNYPLLIYIVQDGTDEENLAWFKKINTAGERLTTQEIRNAVFTGTWVTDAKKYFSKTFCPGIKLGELYMAGVPLRQDYLETVLRWISNNHIEEYMRAHFKDENAKELWDYFEEVISWVKKAFPDYDKAMKGVEWGLLYNQYKDKDVTGLQDMVDKLYKDEMVTSKKGIYSYVFTQDEDDLKLESFAPITVRDAWKRQGKKCAVCGQDITTGNCKAIMHDSWSEGGDLSEKNCYLVCTSCDIKYFREPVVVVTERTPDGRQRTRTTRYNDRKVVLDQGPEALKTEVVVEKIGETFDPQA